MKKIINGEKYIFSIDSFEFGKEVNFSIEAIHRLSHTHSCINNVNCILSVLDVGIYDNRFWESEWIIAKKEADYFFTKANHFLRDNNFMAYIENQLDLDRELGEWSKI